MRRIMFALVAMLVVAGVSMAKDFDVRVGDRGSNNVFKELYQAEASDSASVTFSAQWGPSIPSSWFGVRPDQAIYVFWNESLGGSINNSDTLKVYPGEWFYITAATEQLRLVNTTASDAEISVIALPGSWR